MSLIDELKKEAQQQQQDAENEKAMLVEREDAFRSKLQPKMVMIFNFLSEMCESLNNIKSDIKVSYPIQQYSIMRDMVPVHYKVIVDSRRLMSNIKFTFTCMNDDRIQFNVENKLYIDRIGEFLDFHKIAYVCHKYKDSKQNVTNALFNVDCNVPVEFKFETNVDESYIQLNIMNFNGLNSDRFIIKSEDIDENFTDELGKYILHRDTTLFKLQISNEQRDKIRKRMDEEKKNIIDYQKKNEALTKKQVTSTNVQVKKESEIKLQNLNDKQKPDADVEKTINKVDLNVIESKSTLAKTKENNSTALKQNTLVEENNKIEKNISELEKFQLNFALLPTAYNSTAPGILDIRAHLKKLAGLNKMPVQFVQEVANILSEINKVDVAEMERIEVAHAIYITVYPVIVSICAPYNDERNKPPTDREQLFALSNCIIIAEQVAISYKYAYRKFYSTNKSRYQENKNNIIELGLRILEMIRLEQRLRALRYEKLPIPAWLDANQIFFSLLLYNNIDDDKVLSSEIGISYVKDDGDIELTREDSIRGIYLSIQLFGVLDVVTWPAHLFYFPDAYLEFLDSALRIIEDNGQSLEPAWLITFLHNDGPPVAKRNDSMSAPGFLIDFSILYNALVAEHEELAKMIFLSAVDLDKLSLPLKKLKDQDRIPVLEMVLLSLQRRERRQKRHNVYGTEKLVVNFGFEECYKIFSGYAKPENKNDRQSLEMIELIQQKSVKLSDKIAPESIKTSYWRIVNFSTGGLLITHDNVERSNSLQIGQMVSFKPKNNSNRPLLGYVGRMQRPQDHRLEISIVRMASYTESALIVEQSSNENGKPVLLSKDMDERWQIVVLHEYGYTVGTPLKIIRSNGTQIILRLGDIWLSKRDFSVFEARSAAL